MITTDKVVFLELQKSGCSHIRKLLVEIFGGRLEGKHNRADLRSIAEKHVIGSIRNPWDWYVSLWAFGAGGEGAVRRRVQRRIDVDYYHRELPRNMGKQRISAKELIVSFAHDSVKPVSKWKAAYKDADDPECFRSWLSLMLDPARKFDVGEGFGFSPMSDFAGLLTYRFLRLVTPGLGLYTDERLQYASGLPQFFEEFNIADSVIRTENLENDFIKALEDSRTRITAEALERVVDAAGNRTNVSNRREVDFYYDADSSRLVAEREAFIIDRFGYTGPVSN